MEHAIDGDFLTAAHSEVTRRVRAIYTLDELQPASLTLRKGKGSCSQRIAILEALSRAAAIGTRVHVLWVAGQFWYPRFNSIFSAFIPRRILLLWPEFWIEKKWIGLEEAYGTLDQLSARGSPAFGNFGESLFDAVAATPIDFSGRTCASCGAKYDLSRFVIADGGTFNTRDDALRQHRLFQHTVRGWAFERVFGGRKSS